MLETLKITKDGCKKMRFDGIEFWINPYGMLQQTENWNVADKLVRAGLAYRKFYKNLYGATAYIML